MGYTAYRYDYDVVHYCVKPLDHTYTHTNMDCTWKWVKSQIFEIFLRLNFRTQNSFGIRIEKLLKKCMSKI